MEMHYSKGRYYLLFVYYKLRILVDCSFGRRRLYLAELLHLVNVVLRTNYEMPGAHSIQEIETIFGFYKFIGNNYGYSIMSPAFERPDKELFIHKLKKSLSHNNKVLYLDVGAYVGDYSIGILKFIRSKRLTTIAFEPDQLNYKLMRKNIRINHMEEIRTHSFGLGNKKTKTNRTLDSVLSQSFYKQFDTVFVKVDIEGHEEEAFDGAKNLLKCGKKIHLMIEDCVNPSIVKYLTLHGFRFITKITPYDSFWEMH